MIQAIQTTPLMTTIQYPLFGFGACSSLLPHDQSTQPYWLVFCLVNNWVPSPIHASFVPLVPHPSWTLPFVLSLLIIHLMWLSIWTTWSGLIHRYCYFILLGSHPAIVGKDFSGLCLARLFQLSWLYKFVFVTVLGVPWLPSWSPSWSFLWQMVFCATWQQHSSH